MARNSKSESITIGVLRTDFIHHGDQAGYKQILKYIHPKYVWGLDQNVTAHHESRLLQKYLWLYEHKVFWKRKDLDILFIMYAEEFYRFSWRFKGKAKIVATFHMPPELLAKEIFKGNQRGRVGQFTHWLNKKRFSHIDAAIITNINQKEVLLHVIPEEKIHLIHLGIHSEPLIAEFFANTDKALVDRRGVITTGNWLRDWEFYFSLVSNCPDIEFTLINRKLPTAYREQINQYRNLRFLDNISDKDLRAEFLRAKVHFLPVEALAGSNAILQGLALGCPVLIPDFQAEQFIECRDYIELYTKGNQMACEAKLRQMLECNLSGEQQRSLRAVEYALQHDWKNISDQTMQLFKNLLVN